VNVALSNPVPSTQGAPACLPSRIALNVGGISFGVSSGGGVRLALDPGLTDFASRNPSCDVEIEALWSDHLELPSAAPCFQSGGLWSAYEEAGGLSFYFQSAYLGCVPYKKAEFDLPFTRGRVLLLKRYFEPDLPVYPLEYPLDELLMIHRLSKGAGVELHACGVLAPDGVGRLFVGHSGAGKSTTSRLWLAHPGTRVLSDDRIILRRHNGQLRMYGTPWHGDAGLAAQASAVVDHVFLLEHGLRNEIVPLEKSRAAAELFTRTFVPYHSREGLHNALRFTEQTARAVPISLLRFVPNPTAVEAVLRAS
jgi:hypothetical protein